MDWATCVRMAEDSGIRSRFQIPADGLSGFNCEPGTTISDVWGVIAWAFTYPGDLFLRQPSVANFFELDPHTVGGNVSVGIGVVLTIFVISLGK